MAFPIFVYMDQRVKLKPNEEAFVNKYIECSNSSEAYRFAFPQSKKWKDETVWSKASVLLNSDKVQARIKEMQEELKSKSDITKERILDELKLILDANIADYVSLKTVEVDTRTPEEKQVGIEPEYEYYQTLEFKNFDELTEKQLRAIESVKRTRSGIELKLHGKSWSIERICKMLGFDAPQKSELTFDPIANSPLNQLDPETLRVIRDTIRNSKEK